MVKLAIPFQRGCKIHLEPRMAEKETPSAQTVASRTATVPRGLRRLGAKIRNARLRSGLTLQEVAERAGCSVSMLSKIENEKALPSLTTLHNVVGVLNFNIGVLFDGGAQEEHIIVKDGSRPVILARSGVMLERLVPFGDDHILQGNIHLVEPRSGSDGSLRHEGEEVGYVLEGELDLTVDGRTYRLRIGDSFNFKSHRAHSYRNPGTRRARILWINTPPTF
jgi:transcriptional regulator with XRE-family HTH domain